nr:reverse transcriptase domain-containing protein [Tanacetum cinerariifolium]
PAPVKAVDSNCVTCGGTHSYQNCPATSMNVYQDNIHEYVSQAATANYNQGNTGFRPQMVANQIRPPGFPPVQNNQNNFNRGNNFTQNRGGSWTLPGNTVTNSKEDLKGITTRSGVAYKGPTIPTPSKVVKQGTEVTKDQVQIQAHKVQHTSNLRSPNMKLRFRSPLLLLEAQRNGSNPKEELKGITTRSGVAYQGPTNFAPSKVVKQGAEVTKDQVKTPSSPSTAPIQSPVSQSKTPTLISEPVVVPVSTLMPNLKSFIPYPLRHDNEQRHDQANDQIEKFYEIFKDMSFEISFTDALILIPKFASTLKALIGNKEKLSEMARTSMNE